MAALIIKHAIMFCLLVWFTAAWLYAYWDKEDPATWLCTVVCFFLSVSELFNLIDLVF